MRSLLVVTSMLVVHLSCGSVTAPSSGCDEYCSFITDTCVGEFQQYASEEVCVTYCEERAQLEFGVVDEEVNNTVSCRITHTGFATENPPSTLATHCSHAGPNGGNLCGSWCDNYCHLSLLNCPEEFDGEEALCRQSCMSELGNIRQDGQVNDVSGNTFQCRINHLGLAGGEAAERVGHCNAAKLQESTECVDDAP